ncbi:hypothetical protein CPC08DRAFT_634249 [Agrocybe pediades]|nr:hypothetical protein CPC08DRAFT_634249 [Agrocybe pediades]
MLDVVFRGIDHQLGVPKEKRGFNIRNVSGTPGVKVFVSKFSHRGGSDEWYEVPSDFEDPEKYFWRRKSWEIVVFMDPETQKRKGLYLNPEDSTLDVTFNGFDKEVTVSPPPAGM